MCVCSLCICSPPVSIIYFALENLYFDSHSCEFLSIPLKYRRENNSPHLQVLSHRRNVTISDTTISLFLSSRLSRIHLDPRSNQSRFSSRLLPRFSSFPLFRFHRRGGGNWREPRRSTRREALWRTVNPFRLFLFRPQAEKGGGKGRGAAMAGGKKKSIFRRLLYWHR